MEKCTIISITNATKKKIHHQYFMDGEALKPTDTTAYLRVTINNKLRWNNHIDCPQELEEKPIVRTKVEYFASIWDPHQRKYIDKLESVQRRAARFVTNTPYRYS